MGRLLLLVLLVCNFRVAPPVVGSCFAVSFRVSTAEGEEDPIFGGWVTSGSGSRSVFFGLSNSSWFLAQVQHAEERWFSV